MKKKELKKKIKNQQKEADEIFNENIKLKNCNIEMERKIEMLEFKIGGNKDGIIHELRAELNEFSNKNKSLNSRIDNYGGDLEALSNRRKWLEQKHESSSAEIKSLKGIIESLDSKNPIHLINEVSRLGLIIMKLSANNNEMEDALNERD